MVIGGAFRFEIDVVTPTGAPVVIEEWAMPKEDEAVTGLFRDFDQAFKNPGSLAGKLLNSPNLLVNVFSVANCKL